MAGNTFWEMESWPTDPPGWIFLGRAAILLGDRMYQDDDWGQTGFRDRWRLGHEVAQHTAIVSVNRSRDKTWREVPAVAKVWAEKEQRLGFHKGRVATVSDEIRDWAERGLLPTGVRPREGGEVSSLKPVQWSIQHLHARFFCCEMDPLKPYTAGVSGPTFQQIFVGFPEFFSLARRHYPYPDEKVEQEQQREETSLELVGVGIAATRPLTIDSVLAPLHPRYAGTDASIDAPFVHRMAELIRSKKAKTVNAAAKQVAKEEKEKEKSPLYRQSGEVISIAKRISEMYKNMYDGNGLPWHYNGAQ